LIAIGKDAIPGLLDLLPNLKDVSRTEAYRAIACIEDQRSIPALMAAMDEDSLAINYWAEEGLKRLGLDMVYLEPD
jgi:HEAT repeat protein